MFGRPSKYRLDRPEYLLSVDETGSSCNQKDDGLAGSELFVLPRDSQDLGVKGAVTNIHYTVLCFTSATGEPVMCAIILKSTKDISEIPILWKLEINVRKDVVTGETNYETFEPNYGKGKSMCDGPEVLTWVKQFPVLLVVVQIQVLLQNF
jgi:hypothetical protein